MRHGGFTTLETVLTIGLLASIFGLSAFAVGRLERAFASHHADRELLFALSTAARHARHGVQGSAWGVYIPYDATTRTADSMTVFRGNSYATRVATDDQILPVNSAVAFSSVDFSGASPDTGNDHEIVFTSLSGSTAHYGSVTVSWFGQTNTVTIDADGIITPD